MYVKLNPTVTVLYCIHKIPKSPEIALNLNKVMLTSLSTLTGNGDDYHSIPVRAAEGVGNWEELGLAGSLLFVDDAGS